MNIRNRAKHLALLALALSLLSGCASKPRIQSDYDPSVDFSQYRTYGFFNPMNIEDPNYSTIFGATFRQAIAREMEARGYAPSSEPDLLVNVSARLQDKVQVTQTTSPSPGTDGRNGRRVGWS